MTTPLLEGQRVKLLNTPDPMTEHCIGMDGTVTSKPDRNGIAEMRLDNDAGHMFINAGMVDLLPDSPVTVEPPTIGRIVLYRVGIDTWSPAIVARVRQGTTVDLSIFYPGTMGYDLGCTWGSHVGQWTWPARVPA